jgi:5-methylcytosine-specific restriction endonuclease McrA
MKSKLAKATAISKEVRQKVWERDKMACIYCHRRVPVECANSHFIKRSQLGLGIEQNIVCACPKCHYKYDFGRNSRSMINYTWEYLLSKYDGLKRENLVYHKYSNTVNSK